MRGDIEELERRRTAEHREVAHDAACQIGMVFPEHEPIKLGNL